MSTPSMAQMLEAGVHFGHQTRRWNPKMRRFILGERNGIHVINLRCTLECLSAAQQALVQAKRSGRPVLFVGTKPIARPVMQACAEKLGESYVTTRWLGGMLTNFATVRKSIKRLEDIEKMEKDGTFQALSKKEVLLLNREREKLNEVFGGIRHMKGQPGLVVVSDIKHEHLAVDEARRLRIPVIALCDTNVDPDLVTYPIPSNDDAVKALELLMAALVDSAVGAAPVAAEDKDEAAEAKKEEN